MSNLEDQAEDIDMEEQSEEIGMGENTGETMIMNPTFVRERIDVRKNALLS